MIESENPDKDICETTVSTEYVVDKVGGKPSIWFLVIMFGLMSFNTVSVLLDYFCFLLILS